MQAPMTAAGPVADGRAARRRERIAPVGGHDGGTDVGPTEVERQDRTERTGLIGPGPVARDGRGASYQARGSARPGRAPDAGQLAGEPDNVEPPAGDRRGVQVSGRGGVSRRS